MYFIQRHPLEGLLPDQTPEHATDHLTVLLRPTVLTVLVPKAQSDGLHALQDVSVRMCGPSEWLLVSNDMGQEALGRSLTARGLPWVDQTHGSVVLRLSGPNARTILAKGTGVDLHATAFEVGQSANVLFGQVHANLACIGADTFELIVVRSYASFLFLDLLQAGKEFSLAAAFEGSDKADLQWRT